LRVLDRTDNDGAAADEVWYDQVLLEKSTGGALALVPAPVTADYRDKQIANIVMSKK